VIIDELGRGTSTHDGVAIALATLEHIMLKTRCFTLFVTHHPPVARLVHTFPHLLSAFYMSFHRSGGGGASGGGGGVAAGAESTKRETESEEKESEKEQKEAEEERQATVAFLYKLVCGVAKRSFGLNGASCPLKHVM
jgi:DNA mismatch repair protein MSH3